MKNRFTTILAVAALLVIAGSVLARFNAGGNEWPAVTLSVLADPERAVSSTSIAGEPRVVNFWGSWCVEGAGIYTAPDSARETTGRRAGGTMTVFASEVNS